MQGCVLSTYFHYFFSKWGNIPCKYSRNHSWKKKFSLLGTRLQLNIQKLILENSDSLTFKILMLNNLNKGIINSFMMEAVII